MNLQPVALARKRGIEEKKMFGGVGFLLKRPLLPTRRSGGEKPPPGGMT
jgi:hypothetical protein